MAWEFVRELIINGSKVTFNIPTSFNNILSSIPSPLSVNYWSQDISSDVDNINNYDIAPFPFQAQKWAFQDDITYTIGSDSNNTLRLYYNNQINCYKFSRSTNNINGVTNMINNDNGGYCIIPLINHATQQGIIAFFATAYHFASDAHVSLAIYGTNSNYGIGYQILTDAIPPEYHWYSVSSISGNGKVTSLSQIASASINGGEPVTGASASAFDSLIASSKLSALASGKTEETPIAYSDDENYLAIKDNGDNTCDLRFYLEGQSLLKIQNASQNAYLSILEDDTNQVVKPSIIYKSGNTYSYNTESPSSDTMENLYNWLHIQTRKKENKTGRWSTSFTFSRVEE